MWRVLGWVTAMALLAALIVGILRLGTQLRSC
jgi:hypothetical protein